MQAVKDDVGQNQESSSSIRQTTNTRAVSTGIVMCGHVSHCTKHNTHLTFALKFLLQSALCHADSWRQALPDISRFDDVHIRWFIYVSHLSNPSHLEKKYSLNPLSIFVNAAKLQGANVVNACTSLTFTPLCCTPRTLTFHLRPHEFTVLRKIYICAWDDNSALTNNKLLAQRTATAG